MDSFSPHLEMLPEPQLRLWPRLGPIADLGFALYGGTAIALRLALPVGRANSAVSTSDDR